MKHFFYIFILFVAMFATNKSVFASTYVNDNNYFENSYSNNLIDMAISQYDNFYSSKFVIFSNGYDYYLVVGDNYSINNNSITINNSTIFSAIRVTSGYNYYYDYRVSTENSTTINSNYILVSNTDFRKSVSSKRFTDYRFNYYLLNIFTFILGLLFALFLTRERSHI